MSEIVSSFYFTQLPDRIRACDIFKLFACIGKVLEVVISPRRNKWVRHFGFAKFAGVEDCGVLGIKLDNVIIDDKKIYANQLSFNRRVFSAADGDVVMDSRGRFKEHNEAKQLVFQKRHDVSGKFKGVGSCSFANMVSKGKGHNV